MRKVLAVLLASFCSIPLLAQVPQSQHVYIVLEENHSYETVVGQMPYLNGLAAQNTLLINSFANSHFSIPNYMWLTTGQFVTDSDGTQLTFDVDNIVRHLQTAGLSWKAYMEGIPNAGYTGFDLPTGCGTAPNNCIYVKHHDPFPYFTDVANSSEALNIVPMTQLATDIANGTLPNYGFITPSLQNDGHNGTLTTVDSWLQTNIAPLLATAPFQPGGDGLLIVTWDEGQDTDCRPAASCPPLPENVGGGKIYTVIVGPQVKQNYQSTTTADHNAILRLMMQALGLSSTGFPGASATAADLSDIFVGNPAPSPTPTPTPVPTPTPGVTVTLTSPANGSTIPAGQPLQITASAASGFPITGWHAYANSVNVATGPAGNNFSTQVNLAAGTYTLIVKAWNSSGSVGQQKVTVAVGSSPTPTPTPTPSPSPSPTPTPTPTPTPSPTPTPNPSPTPTPTPSVSITAPAAGATVTSPVVVKATFNNGGTPQYMKVWVDGVSKFLAKGVDSITTPGLVLTTGSHRVTVQAFTTKLYSSSETITVH